MKSRLIMEGHGNRAKGKRWQGVLNRRIEALQALDGLADALITEALTGNIAALKEIGDRLDGKPRQEMDVSISNHESALDELK